MEAISDTAMPSALSREKLVRFAVRAAIVVASLFAVSRLVPVMPLWALAVVWALFSFASMMGIAYHDVIDKTYRQTRFTKGGMLGRFNAGRIFCLIVGFVLSAVCMASLLVSSARWDVAMWLIVVLSIPVYVGMTLLIGARMAGEVQPLYRASFGAKWGAVAGGVVLSVVYAGVVCVQPVETYRCAADAFLAVPELFEASPSVVLSEAGTLEALVQGLSAYALSKAAEQSFQGYVVACVLLNAGAFFAVAGLLSVCSIEPRELGRVFTELENSDNRDARRKTLARYVALAAVLPALLIGAFFAMEANFDKIVNEEPYALAKRIVKEQVDLAVFTFDGKHYDPEAVRELIAKTSGELDALERDAHDNLVALVNTSFDKRLANVDAYLDWYYRIFGDWEQLAMMLGGAGEEFAQKQFEAYIEQGIDDSQLAGALSGYIEAVDKLREERLAELEQYEIVGGYPEWMMTEVSTESELDGRLDVMLKPSQESLDARGRLGVSAGAGIAAGFLVRSLVKKLAGKTIFKAAAERAGSVAAAAGVGSLGGPVAVAVALVFSVGVDVALTKLDELTTRDSLKQEIVAAIEEQRAEVLADVNAQFA